MLLGIESSCDETAAAVYDGEKLLAHVIHTQEIHEKYGGVVPELASREHLKNIIPVVDKAFKRAEITWDDVNCIAVTRGPGLVGSLLIGVSFAKAAAFARNIRLIGVNHIEAHLWAPVFEFPGLKPPFIGLIISGGHTQIWWIKDYSDYILMGQTLDDAVGEAFDKTAQMLDLEYPGGPAIDKLSRTGDPGYHHFPRPVIRDNPFDFSFSGLKTSVLYYLDAISRQEMEEHKADIAASFQQAVIDTLVQKTFRAAVEVGVDTIILGGGVASNSALKKQMTDTAVKRGMRLCCPSPEFCTDNAAMIAYIGYKQYLRNQTDSLSLSVNPSLKLSESGYKPENQYV